MSRARHAMALTGLLCLLLPAAPASAGFVETPFFVDAVAAGNLPPVAERLPTPPAIEPSAGRPAMPGAPGGTIRMLMAKSQDVRMVAVYGYARLVGYGPGMDLVPDLLESFDVEEGRVFTLRLRAGHRWSDGQPFTSEDFRYYWEDVAHHPDLSPSGPPVEMRVGGELPRFEVIDDRTVRYSWSVPNPGLLHALAGARPLYLYMPAHYLKRFHERYADPDELAKSVKAAHVRNWAALHTRNDSHYKNDNPDLPSLDPWVNTTTAPAERFVFVRNPYFHRVDETGRQLPYADKVEMFLSAAQLIPAKVGAGEVDLQARYLRFDNITFLKQGERRGGYEVKLWRTGTGAHIALFPNLNVADPVWRDLFRDVRFRRALSLAINRHEINRVVFYGLAVEGGNTLLPGSPLFDPERRQRWSTYDLARADALLDDMGLKRRGWDGLRTLPDGRKAEIVIETAEEGSEQSDVLQLIHDTWLKVGIKLYVKPLQREVFRNRIFAGTTQMAVWSGLENGLANPAMSPAELAPTSQQQLQWPRWGQYYETAGRAGERPADPAAERLLELYREWRNTADPNVQREVWEEMLDIQADAVFSLGIVGGTLQPVVVSNRLRNVPDKGVYSWEPGAHFGMYRPDTFWFAAPGAGK